METAQKGNDLHGFSETHFVADDSARLLAVELPEPSDAGFLVVEKFCGNVAGEGVAALEEFIFGGGFECFLV
jgi:hypothetical protein